MVLKSADKILVQAYWSLGDIIADRIGKLPRQEWMDRLNQIFKGLKILVDLDYLSDK